MNQNILRFKDWLSAFRPFALGDGLVGMFIFLGLLNRYNLASRAARSPLVEIGQLLRGEFEPHGLCRQLAGLRQPDLVVEQTGVFKGEWHPTRRRLAG